MAGEQGLVTRVALVNPILGLSTDSGMSTEGPDSINNFGSQLSRTYVDERKSNTSANDRDRLEGVGGHIELPALDMFAFSGPSLSILFLATNDSAFKSLKCRPFHPFLNTCMMRYQISNQVIFSRCPE